MSGLVDWLTTQLATNPAGVAAVVALLAMGEAIIIVGAFIPGVTVILAISAAAGATGHGLWPVFFAAAFGTIFGDLVSYALGRHYGMRIAQWGPLRRRPHVFASAERHFEKRGAISVALTRFIPAVRSLVPTFAGIAKMRPWVFIVASVVSGIAWAAIYVFAAAFVAGVLAALGGRIAVVVIGAVILLGLAIWLGRIVASFTIAWIMRARLSAHRWVLTRNGRAARLLAWTLDPEDLTGLLVVLWSAVLCVALYLFAELTGNVWQGEDIVRADLALSRFVQSLRTPGLDDVMITITMLGDAVVLSVIAAASIAYLLFRRDWWNAIAFLGAVLTPLAFVPLVKGALGRTRPLADLYTGVDNYSFPSGHSTNSMVLFGVLAVLIAGSLRGRWRWFVAGLIALIPLAIAGSRIYLQAHWPSDVAAGLAFAIGITAAFVLVVNWLSAGIVEARGLAIVAGAALVVAGSIHIALGFEKARLAYEPRDLTIALTPAEWQDKGWQIVGHGQVDFEGDIKTPFFLQWVGDRAALTKALTAAGWSPAKGIALSNLGEFVTTRTTVEELPVLPQLHLGRAPTEVWSKPLDDRHRLVFRLWVSRYTVGDTPLYVGSGEQEIARPILGLFTMLYDSAWSRTDAERLQKAIAAAAGPEDGKYSISFKTDVGQQQEEDD